MKKLLVLMFHPRLESSTVNRQVFNTLQQASNLVVKDMYELYPDFNIDVKAEQQGLAEADIIVMQHPFFWYSAPPLMKQWIDLVLEQGWAYGKGGEALKGKVVFHIISSGGGFDAYAETGKNLYTYHELLRPFELTYRLCLMEQLPPFIIPWANRITPQEMEATAHRIKAMLIKMRTDELNCSDLQRLNYLNDLKI